ncbi:gluconokinase [uncultured Corynebacterium sp.]|uniref:gluconokinase n=1 Tax=uncultured Corynebacterium sp. TaxID=159447 RepID=UPI0025EF6F12|nr:gluconokinase [uncultured Corynebacterium sp.]
MSENTLQPVHLVIMGVSASGKTTLAERLAATTGFPYAEADDFHPAANKEKMASGHALNDDDRWPWLRSLADWMVGHANNGDSSIVTCSALKHSYRDVLRAADGVHGGRVLFVELQAPAPVLLERLNSRTGHFMPASLLDSQLDTLEPLTDDENGLTLDATADPEGLAAEVLAAAGLGRQVTS